MCAPYKPRKSAREVLEMNVQIVFKSFEVDKIIWGLDIYIYAVWKNFFRNRGFKKSHIESIRIEIFSMK